VSDSKISKSIETKRCQELDKESEIKMEKREEGMSVKV
jgi:hypothetical protein